jgi:hypothetical protein
MKIDNCIKLAMVAILMLVASGCVTIGNRKLDDVNNYLQLKEQQSTKANVYATFGQPHDVRKLDSGDTVWVYYKVHTRPSAWTYVPFVGLAAGGSAREMTFAYFAFDKTGTLQKIQTKSGSDYENTWAGLGRALNRMSDKTQAERVQEEMASIGKPFEADIAKRVSSLRDK